MHLVGSRIKLRFSTSTIGGGQAAPGVSCRLGFLGIVLFLCVVMLAPPASAAAARLSWSQPVVISHQPRPLGITPVTADALLGTTASTTNLIQNGQFKGTDPTKTPAAGGCTEPQAAPDPSSTDIPAWMVTAGNVDWCNGYWTGPSSSDASDTFTVDLNGSTAGKLEQSVTTTSGQTYALSFALSANPNCGQVATDLAVTWNRTQVGADYLVTPTWDNSTMAYTIKTATVTGTGTDVLDFVSKGSGLCGPVIGDVSLTPGSSMDTLTVTPAGAGSGSVSSDTGGISCVWNGSSASGTCSHSYAQGAQVTLTEQAASGSTFTSWSGGGCSGSQPTCTVTMDQARSVTATFALVQHTLTVSKSGSGSGSVSSPSGISCGSACSAQYDFGTVVTLTATPASGVTFTGWSGGGCSGTGTCIVTMSSDQAVTATFATTAPPPAACATSWCIVPTADGAGSSGTELSSVSCPSTSFCEAVGNTWSGIRQHADPVIERWQNGQWETPITLQVGGRLGGVSCWSASDCLAVGASGAYQLVERYHDGKWMQYTKAPHIIGIDPYAVSCPKAGWCMVVGHSYGSNPYAEYWSAGHGWTPTKTDATVPNRASADLRAVSCVAADDCIAVGDQLKGRPPEQLTLAEHWDGHQWKQMDTPNPSGGSDGFTGVSCVAANACVAVGSWPEQHMLAERLTAAGWQLDEPHHARSLAFEAVDCASVRHCEAVGQTNAIPYISPLAESWSSGSWSRQSTQNPPNNHGAWFAQQYSGAEIAAAGVSCPTSKWCMAVGHWDHTDGYGMSTFAERYRS